MGGATTPRSEGHIGPMPLLAELGGDQGRPGLYTWRSYGACHPNRYSFAAAGPSCAVDPAGARAESPKPMVIRKIRLSHPR